MRIITPGHGDHGDYLAQLSLTGFYSLQEWRETLTEKFYVRNVLDSESRLHYLLLAKSDTAVTAVKLRHTRSYELIMSRTEKFPKSFIPYSIVR